MQIPILNGIYTNEESDFRTSYPYNLVPVPVDQGISKGYLCPAEGIQLWGAGAGRDRGGINWNGVCYRVMGNQFISIDANGVPTNIEFIPGTDQVTFDYSFTYLGIAAAGHLYLYDGVSVQQVTDPDLGTVIDFIWVDGYFMTTDGEFLIVTELNNPFSVLTTKYGTSEEDPDPVVAILKLHNEPTAVNRYTTEIFSNVGGTGFPFTRIDGALMSVGAVGTHACCIYLDNIAIVGGGRNEAVSVHLGSNGQSVRIATREIDLVLAEYSETVLAQTKIESRVDKGHALLYIHLVDRTLVYDGNASKIVGEPVWFILGTGMTVTKYRARNLVRCYNKWIVGDTDADNFGYLSTDTTEHWGLQIGWEFSTIIIYNESAGCIFHELELVCLSGRVDLHENPMIATYYSLDGESWSQLRYITAGRRGERQKRLVWLNQGNMRNWRVQKFSGDSTSRLSIARLEARLEPLAV